MAGSVNDTQRASDAARRIALNGGGEQASQGHAQAAERSIGLNIFGYSFLILFVELALIRYVPGYVRLFAFYLNFVLIATFLGMGSGFIQAANAAKLRWLAIPTMLLLLGAVAYLSRVLIYAPIDPNEFLFGSIAAESGGRQARLLPAVLVLFALCALVFVPLGASLGQEFGKLPSLIAYSLNIGGSLLGIIAFGALSALRTSPLVWFSVAFAIWMLLSLGNRRFLLGLGLTAAASLALIRWTGSAETEFWSPYYRINVFRSADVYPIHVNGAIHQYAVNLDTGLARRNPFVAAVRDDYLRPLRLLPRTDTIMVIGAGTGNDVTMMLDYGAKRVDAVEIDPVILALGRTIHFQQPYSDPRVQVHITDGRAFLRNTKQRYDVIVIGTLDSHTLLSGMSSVRLDNYIFTREAFAAARDRLKPDGHLVTFHMAPTPEVAAKIRGLIKDVFQAEPLVFYEPNQRLFNYTFVAGPALPASEANAALAAVPTPVTPQDNWPYLYLDHPTIPLHYLVALAGIIAIAVAMTSWAAGRRLRSGFDGSMFLLGTGFLLVETKSVSEMSLLFGATWQVNLLVFSAVLVVVLVANAIALRRPAKTVTPLFLGLFASLALAYAVPARSLLWLGNAGQWFAGGALVALPILFSSLIFARLLRNHPDPTRAVAYNLLGAIAGGILEYSSMVLGIKGLYLVAALAYGGAWLFTVAGRKRLAVPAPGTALMS